MIKWYLIFYLYSYMYINCVRKIIDTNRSYNEKKTNNNGDIL